MILVFLFWFYKFILWYVFVYFLFWKFLNCLVILRVLLSVVLFFFGLLLSLKILMKLRIVMVNVIKCKFSLMKIKVSLRRLILILVRLV